MCDVMRVPRSLQAQAAGTVSSCRHQVAHGLKGLKSPKSAPPGLTSRRWVKDALSWLLSQLPDLAKLFVHYTVHKRNVVHHNRSLVWQWQLSSSPPGDQAFLFPNPCLGFCLGEQAAGGQWLLVASGCRWPSPTPRFLRWVTLTHPPRLHPRTSSSLSPVHLLCSRERGGQGFCFVLSFVINCADRPNPSRSQESICTFSSQG